jgi:hypothetical protein
MPSEVSESLDLVTKMRFDDETISIVDVWLHTSLQYFSGKSSKYSYHPPTIQENEILDILLVSDTAVTRAFSLAERRSGTYLKEQNSKKAKIKK